jgi:hypothetical protein
LKLCQSLTEPLFLEATQGIIRHPKLRTQIFQTCKHDTPKPQWTEPLEKERSAASEWLLQQLCAPLNPIFSKKGSNLKTFNLLHFVRNDPHTITCQAPCQNHPKSTFPHFFVLRSRHGF